MADYDPMNPVHAGPKSPKIKATIRGGGYTSPENDEKPVEGIPIRRYSWDDIERMENTFVPPHLFEASGGRIRTELDMYTFQASGGKADLPDYPRIKPHEYRLGIPNFNEDLELRLAKAGARARRGEFIKDRPEPLVVADGEPPHIPPPLLSPKNNKKPVKKDNKKPVKKAPVMKQAPVKKAVVMVKKPRPKGD